MAVNPMPDPDSPRRDPSGQAWYGLTPGAPIKAPGAGQSWGEFNEFGHYTPFPGFGGPLAAYGVTPNSGGFGFSASFTGNPFSGGGQAPGASAAPGGYGSSGGTLNGVTQPGIGGTLYNSGAQAGSGGWLANNWQRAAGAGLSAFGAYNDSQAARQGGSSSGSFNTQGSSTPWMPQYNQAGLDAALALLQGQRGGGGGGGGQPFNYASDDILEGLMGVVRGGDPLYGPANAYASGTLGGQSQNPYMDQLFQSMGSASDPYVDQFLQQMMGGGFGGPNYAGGGGGGGGGFISASGGGGMPASAGEALGIADYLRPVLEGQFLGEENPYLAEVISSAQERARQAYMETELPEINAEFEGAGRYGGSEFGIARALGADRLGQILGDISSTLGYQGYDAERQRMMEAMGLGTQWDMHLGNLGADYASIAAQERSSAGATAAQAGSAAQDRALQEWLGRLGATTDVLGLRSGLTGLGMEGQMGLAQLMSADQQFALGMVPELSGLDIRDWTAGLDRGLALDQLRLGQRQSNQANARASANQPWDNLLRYTDVVRGLTGGYGNTTESGFDQRQGGGGGSSTNDWLQAAMAAMAGWQAFSG